MAVFKVLGSAAGGGFPQWNCNCPNCAGLRAGGLRAAPRTQSSVALSADGQDWLLINASPEVLQQIRQTPALQPARALRDSGVAAVLLIDAQIDHTAGLLMLRERATPLPLYATPEVLGDLEQGLGLPRLLGHYGGLAPRALPLDGGAIDAPFLGPLQVQALPLHSQPPPFSPYRGRPRRGDTVGLKIHNPQTGRKLFYAPGLGRIDAPVWAAMQWADTVLVDGTFWSETEMIDLGLSGKRAAEMGHLPQSGAEGMLHWLRQLPPSTGKWLIHINNSNPVLREDSAEHAELRAAGVALAYDGLEIVL
ncbi:pyrroloquinoline quinone biosynthesis protein PqqB [Roseateles sp. BYS180W]|uniref:Coenzyme PQQ synthesis protein B n=1 Tax=Roseateles rivi TaxID=3299028 RepID=A0ABW7FRU1_9BURK